MLDRPFQVLIADDHPLVRAGVMATLQPLPDFTVVGEASNGHEILRMVAEQTCDMLLMDLEMEGPGVGDLVQSCQRLQPDLKILILSSHVEERHLAPLKGLGIAGYVVKDETPDSLIQALRVVASGSGWFSHIILRRTLELSREEKFTTPLQTLTSREKQVLRLIREAKDNQTIADELRLSKQTVRRYATLIYEKLGVKNRVEAIVRSSR